MNVQPFTPLVGQTQAILATATSQFIMLTAGGAAVNCILVFNGTTTPIAVRTGLAIAGAVVAVAPVVGTPGDMVIAPGAYKVISKGYNDTVAVVTAITAGTGDVYITPGEGQ